MGKISKTAAASMKGGLMPVKADPFDTNEKKIKELRNQRRDKLAVGRFDFIDALIEEYDKVLLLLAQEVANVVVQQEALKAAEAQIKSDVYVMGEISKARDEIVKELEATRKINQVLLGMNEKLNGQLNQTILQRDEMNRKLDEAYEQARVARDEFRATLSESEKLQAELEPLPERGSDFNEEIVVLEREDSSSAHEDVD